MSDISFLAVPNIAGMRLVRYIKIFGIVLLFGVCLFFALYFRFQHRRRKALFLQLDTFDRQAQELAQQMLIDKIRQTSGKTKLILFIEYLERFVTTKPYANPGMLLISQGFSAQDAEECKQVLYQDKDISHYIAKKIDDYFIS